MSIDPEARAICDALCDEVIRQHLEDIDLDLLPPWHLATSALSTTPTAPTRTPT